MQTLLKETKKQLLELGIEANLVNYGQHFLIDKLIIQQFVKACELKPGDKILEVGPGLGFLSKELLKSNVTITAVEIDERFKTNLNDLAYTNSNFKYQFANILDLNFFEFNFNTIVGSLSYSIFEPLLYRLIETKFDKAIFLVSRKFLETEGVIKIILEAFFDLEIIAEVDRSQFYPIPKYSGVIIRVFKKVKKEARYFLWRELILQRDKKLKNSFREALINWYKINKKELTKKQAKKIFLEKLKDFNFEKKFTNLNKSELSQINSFFDIIT